MNLRLDLRLHLGGEGDQEAVRRVVVVEARKFTATLADALEAEGIEVEVDGVDHLRGWRRLIRS